MTDKYEKLDEGVEFIETKMLELSRPADLVLGFAGAMLIGAPRALGQGHQQVTPPRASCSCARPTQVRRRALPLRRAQDPHARCLWGRQRPRGRRYGRRRQRQALREPPARDAPEGHPPRAYVEASKALVEKRLIHRRVSGTRRVPVLLR